MIRWIRLAAIGLVTLSIVTLGVGVGLFLIENDRWEEIEIHGWLRWVFGDSLWEVWMPLLIAGWLLAIIALGALFLWSVFYVWRRRQYEGEIRRLRRELIALRNLPFDDPAPFEDQDERPDPAAARIMQRIERGLGHGDGPFPGSLAEVSGAAGKGLLPAAAPDSDAGTGPSAGQGAGDDAK